MDVSSTVLALCFLMAVAYRGTSVILFAPVAAMLAVVLQGPGLLPPMFSGVFMEKLVGFLKPYLSGLPTRRNPFGKLIELFGIARAISERVTLILGRATSWR